MRQTAFEENLGTLEELDEVGRRKRKQPQPVRRIPYDYVATFTLTGDPGRRIQTLINVSAEASFICTSIGYGAEEPKIYQTFLDHLQDFREDAIIHTIAAFEKAKSEAAAKPEAAAKSEALQTVAPQLVVPQPVAPQLVENKITKADFQKLKQRFGTYVGIIAKPPIFTTIENLIDFNKIIHEQVPGENVVRNVIQNFRDALSFKYAIIDKGSGRELQNAPIHNLAGLGRLDGTRPFRELPVPYVFSPNSSVLIEITELVTLAGAILHIDFQGFKEFR